ncbi:MAG: DUF6569 family protein [Planctomycetota bacterium]
MRDQWYGDNRDVVKWAVLVHLAETHQLKKILQVAFYRPSDTVPMLTAGRRRAPISPAVINHFRNLEQIGGLAEAFASQALKVTEVTAQGSVPELYAVSESETCILILDGEELVGAKQNRILNTDVLLRPRSKTKIPVSCVEQGRWHHVRPDFVVGSQAPPAMRARKLSSVSRSLRESGQARSDQGEVWEGVGELLCAMGTPSETAAMADAFRQRQDDLGEFVRGLPCPEEAVGVMVMINERFTCVDLFDRPRTLQQVWPRLVSGYAADAIAQAAAPVLDETSVVGAAILDRLRQAECVACAGVDLGEDWRFETPELLGSALVVEGAALHLSAFPSDPAGARRDSNVGRIASPSQRRRPPRPPVY